MSSAFLKTPPLPENRRDALSTLPTDVLAFSRKNDLDDYLRKAVELAKVAFAPLERIEPEVHQDRETQDQCIVLSVVVRGDLVDVSAARKKYSAEWVASVPAPERFLIRLSPDII